MEQCQPLYEYVRFVNLVREYSKTMNLKEAIDLAVEQVKEWKCIGDFFVQMEKRGECYAID